MKVLRRCGIVVSFPRHRRDACSIAWRCRFLTARPSQDGAPGALVDFHTGREQRRGQGPCGCSLRCSSIFQERRVDRGAVAFGLCGLADTRTDVEGEAPRPQRNPTLAQENGADTVEGKFSGVVLNRGPPPPMPLARTRGLTVPPPPDGAARPRHAGEGLGTRTHWWISTSYREEATLLCMSLRRPPRRLNTVYADVRNVTKARHKVEDARRAHKEALAEFRRSTRRATPAPAACFRALDDLTTQRRRVPHARARSGAPRRPTPRPTGEYDKAPGRGRGVRGAGGHRGWIDRRESADRPGTTATGVAPADGGRAAAREREERDHLNKQRGRIATPRGGPVPQVVAWRASRPPTPRRGRTPRPSASATTRRGAVLIQVEPIYGSNTVYKEEELAFSLPVGRRAAAMPAGRPLGTPGHDVESAAAGNAGAVGARCGPPARRGHGRQPHFFRHARDDAATASTSCAAPASSSHCRAADSAWARRVT